MSGLGADERSGWDEEATRYDGLDLPEESPESNQPAASRSWLWISVGIALLILFVLGLLFR